MTAEASAPPGAPQGSDAEQRPGNVGEPAERTPFNGFCAHLSCRHLSCLLLSLQLQRQIFLLSRSVLVRVHVSATSWTS